MARDKMARDKMARDKMASAKNAASAKKKYPKIRNQKKEIGKCYYIYIYLLFINYYLFIAYRYARLLTLSSPVRFFTLNPPAIFLV